jgi:hypothetical protein
MATESGHLTRLLPNLSAIDRIKLYNALANSGVTLGNAAASTVGFWGSAPIARPTVTAVSSSAATTTLNETRITRIETLLVTLGLVTTT